MRVSVQQLESRLQKDFSFFFKEDVDSRFQSLVKDHQVRLQRFISKHIGPSEDSAELTQQAFLIAYEAYPSFKGESAFSTWLYGIAMNLVRNHLSRAPTRRYEFLDTTVLEDFSQNEQGPQDSAELAQKLHYLNAALQHLPAHMQKVLLLIAIEERSYEEVANLLGIPVGTVRSRLSRARSLLKAHLIEIEN